MRSSQLSALMKPPEAQLDEELSGSEDWDDAFLDLGVDNVDDGDDAGSSAPPLPRRLPDVHVDICSRHIEWDDRTGRVFEHVAGGNEEECWGLPSALALDA